MKSSSGEVRAGKPTQSAYNKAAGALLFVGAAQFLTVLIVAEALSPSYSISGNFISDLGVGSTALLFNSSLVLLGLMAIMSGYLIQRALRNRLLAALLVVAGAGAAGAGLFPEGSGSIHSLAQLVAFLFGGLSAIAAYRLEKPPLTYFSLAMGVLALVALVLRINGNFLGLGTGGIERLVAYPILLWAIGFGGHLMS